MNITPTWTIEPGQIKISEDGVWLVIDEENVKVWEIDLESKYPSLLPAYVNNSEGGHGYEVYIVADEDTIKIDDETEKTTKFVIHGLERGWFFMVDGARYTVRIVMYRYPKESHD